MMLKELIDEIEPVHAIWIQRALDRQLQLTKPPGSLGRLEEIANRLVAIQQTLTPDVERAKIVVFAADHGICEEGVNPYPQAVSAQMVANYLRGGAAINALASVAGADLEIVNMGLASAIAGNERLVDRSVGPGTKNFCRGPAMSREEAVQALLAGAERARQAVEDGYRLVGFGEMGIGNTTAASAVTAALTGLPASAVIGRGTGADDACLSRKVSAVERALELHGPVSDPLEIIERLGGFEIAAMCGFCLGAAARRCAILTDGFIATAAAALAISFKDSVRDYLFASHRSAEPGHAPLLERIGQTPLLDLSMRLGEGTGAALAVPIVRAAAAAFTRMATFQSAGVSEAGATAQ